MGMMTAGNGIKMDLLWTNSNTNNSFGKQTVSISTEKYDYYFVIHTGTGAEMFLFVPGVQRALTDPLYSIAFRYATISPGKATFEEGKYFNAYMGSQIVDNHRCKPWKIFGVKL